MFCCDEELCRASNNICRSVLFAYLTDLVYTTRLPIVRCHCHEDLVYSGRQSQLSIRWAARRRGPKVFGVLPQACTSSVRTCSGPSSGVTQYDFVERTADGSVVCTFPMNSNLMAALAWFEN